MCFFSHIYANSSICLIQIGTQFVIDLRHQNAKNIDSETKEYHLLVIIVYIYVIKLKHIMWHVFFLQDCHSLVNQSVLLCIHLQNVYAEALFWSRTRSSSNMYLVFSTEGNLHITMFMIGSESAYSARDNVNLGMEFTWFVR